MCYTKQGVTTCDVAIWFGAHVARGQEWTDTSGSPAGDGFAGAASISGSPYHVALAAKDGESVGQRDNQMQSGTIVLPGTKRGTKFEDLNADGIWDPDGPNNISGDGDDEPGIANWNIYLLSADGSTIEDQVATGPDGSYIFYDVTPDTDFLVCESAQNGGSGWHQSAPMVGDFGYTTACGTATAVTGLAPAGYLINLPPETDESGNDFGNYIEAPSRASSSKTSTATATSARR